ncbi:MAG: cytochrome c oxidase subunit 3 [Bacteroidota bacterium]
MANVAVDKKALIEGERPIFNASYGKLMMWFFLMSDAFTFSALLIAYGALRVRSGEQGVLWADPEAVFTHTPLLYELFHIEAPLVFVGIMTFILILSSVTMVLAVEAGHRRSQKEVEKWMFWTIIGGLTFVLCQAYEWYHFIIGHSDGAFALVKEGYDGVTALLVSEPGVVALKDFDGVVLAKGSSEFINAINAQGGAHELGVSQIVDIAKANGAPEIGLVLEGATKTSGGANMIVNEYGPPAFANLFFFVTGFHGSHVLSGVILNYIIYRNVKKGTYEKRGHYEMIEKVGLYWHFVDLVWVFVFTFFYLV